MRKNLDNELKNIAFGVALGVTFGIVLLLWVLKDLCVLTY